MNPFSSVDKVFRGRDTSYLAGWAWLFADGRLLVDDWWHSMDVLFNSFTHQFSTVGVLTTLKS